MEGRFGTSERLRRLKVSAAKPETHVGSLESSWQKLPSVTYVTWLSLTWTYTTVTPMSTLRLVCF